MSQTLYTGLTIDVRQVTETSVETDANGNKYESELPGFLEYGVNMDGHFQVIYREKAPGTLADVERNKAAAAAAAQPPAVDPSQPQG